MSAHHGLHLEQGVRTEAQQRLLSVRGHVEGLLRMVDDPQVYCVDLLKQVKAVRGALERVAEAVLKSHLRSHVVNAAERGDVDQIVTELMDVLKYR